VYGLIVSLSVQEDQRAAFETLVQGIARAVGANEPDNVAYHVLRTRGQPNEYRIVEIYRSKEAFKSHLAADYVVGTNAEVRKTLLCNPRVEVMEIV
jgi:quinol monooxygenase YgiN